MTSTTHPLPRPALEAAMQWTRACTYAVSALVYLAQQKSDALVASHLIALARGIPDKFLLKILKQLVAAGLLRSLKGPGGGYRLARPAHDISLLQVVEVMDGPVWGQVPAFGGDRLVDQRLQAVFTEVAEAVRELLRKVSLASLARRSK